MRLMRKSRRARFWMSVVVAFVILSFLLSIVSYVWAAVDEVFVLSIDGAIDPAVASYIERGFKEAESVGARAVLLEINTPGGAVDSALRIRNRMDESPLQTIVLVKHSALSAGSLIALAGDVLVMRPGSTIGAAEPRWVIPGSEPRPVDAKTLSAWKAEMEGTARAHGRDVRIAAGMVDVDMEIEGVKSRGELLTLTAEQARELGMCDAVQGTRQQALKFCGLGSCSQNEVNMGAAEHMARVMTNPLVAGLFLMVGIALLVIEIFTLGWGIPGTLGLICIGLFFGGHLVAGLAGWESVVLFLLGVVLLLLEILVVPGFGIPGIVGLVALGGSVFLAVGSIEQALITLAIAGVGAVLLVILALRYIEKRNYWPRFILMDRQSSQEGYTSRETGYDRYVGQQGEALTVLRPSGTALIDGERLDVVSEGDFVEPGQKVRVVKVEGLRIVVRPEK